MLHTLYSQMGILALALSCGLAVWQGDAPERAGGWLVLATWLATAAAAFSAKNLPAAAFLISDAVLAAGLLVLAIRYSSGWMGAAMLLQAVSLSLHAAYFTADQSEISLKTLKLYVFGKNLASGAMLLVLLAATTTSMFLRRRRGARRTDAKDGPTAPMIAAE